jgi:cytoskeletal protein CcmA (bactofilin family)
MSTNDVSVLGEDASLSGRISGQDLMILGAFDGELKLSGRLRLGPNARVKAIVAADTVEVEGRFDGEIRSKRLSFAPTAQARGLFLSDHLAVREGAMVEGAFNLGTASDARPSPKAETPVEAPAAPPAAPVDQTATPPAA